MVIFTSTTPPDGCLSHNNNNNKITLSYRFSISHTLLPTFDPKQQITNFSTKTTSNQTKPSLYSILSIIRSHLYSLFRPKRSSTDLSLKTHFSSVVSLCFLCFSSKKTSLLDLECYKMSSESTKCQSLQLMTYLNTRTSQTCAFLITFFLLLPLYNETAKEGSTLFNQLNMSMRYKSPHPITTIISFSLPIHTQYTRKCVTL